MKSTRSILSAIITLFPLLVASTVRAEPQPDLATSPATPEPSAPRASATTVRHPWASEPAADAPPQQATVRSVDDDTVLHGFRLGYGYIMNYDKPAEALGGESLKDKVGLRTPSHFLLGYELVYRVVGHSWLNVLLLANGMVAGLEQSKVLPTANLMIGAELRNSFQIGVGASLSPLAGEEAHTIIAAGWTPRVGTIYTPVHFFFIPDVDGVHRMGLTTGVTF